MPSWRLFEEQPKEYKDKIFPPNVRARIAVEAGTTMGWKEYVGLEGKVVARRDFGASAPIKDLLKQFGFTDFSESDFLQPEQMIQLGRPPNRIDLLTSISGVTNDEALTTKISAELDGIPVFILAKDALIRNKRAVGRPQDIADLDTLER